MKKYKINNGTYDIYINEYEAKGDRFVIGCHGLKSSKDIRHFHLIGEELNRRNIAFLTFDFVGHGESKASGENLNNSSSLQDLLLVFKEGHRKYKGACGLLGTSYGSEMVWEFAYDIRELKIVKKIVALNAAIKRDKVIEKFLGEKVKEIDEKGFTIIGKSKPLIITEDYLEGLRHHEIYGGPREDIDRIFIHGTHDPIAPYDDVVDFTKKNNFKLYSLEDEGHVFSPLGEEISSRIIGDFMDDL